MKNEIADAAIRISPPAAVMGWHWITGWPLQTWVQAATLIYVVLQTYLLVRKEWREWRKSHSKRGGKK